MRIQKPVTQRPKVIIDFEAPIPPTKKQMAFIDDIETYTGVKFRGETMEEASEYITCYIDEYRDRRREDEFGEDILRYPGRKW